MERVSSISSWLRGPGSIPANELLFNENLTDTKIYTLNNMKNMKGEINLGSANWVNHRLQ